MVTTTTTTTTSYCTDDGNECQNGGVCVLATDQSDFDKDGNFKKTPINYCQCPEGTSGNLCHGKNVCTLKCEHASSCRHYDDITHSSSPEGFSDSEFYCECAGNYKGQECEIPYTTCPKTSDDENEKPLQCLYGGVCEISVDSTNIQNSKYICRCPNGRNGTNCENGTTSSIKDYNGPCFDDDDCNNQGICADKHDAATTEETGMTTKTKYCQCKSGYGGDNCELSCDSLKCQHGSSCRFHSATATDATHANDETDTGAYCDCIGSYSVDTAKNNIQLYKGQECEIELKICPGDNKMECLYGGSCVGSQDDTDGDFYTCDCPPNRIGKHCEIYGYTNENNVINNNNNDVIVSSSSSSADTRTNNTKVLASGALIVLSSIIIIIVGVMFFTKRRRAKNLQASQRAAAADALDDSFNNNNNNNNNNDDQEEEENNNNDNYAMTKNEDMNGNGSGAGAGAGAGANGEDDFYDAEDDADDFNNDGIVNVNLDDDKQIV
jgi:hypothetical protein